MPASSIPEEEWSLLANALEEPVEQLIAVEVQDSAQLREVEQRLLELAGSRPLLRQALRLDDRPQDAWRHARQLTQKTDSVSKTESVLTIPLLLVTMDANPQDAMQRQALAEFWRGMNQLRENWHDLPAQTVFLLSPDAYQHLTLNADHLKRWISLKVRLWAGSTDLAVLARPGGAIGVKKTPPFSYEEFGELKDFGKGADELKQHSMDVHFDVFLSYAKQDGLAVRELASALRGRGLSVWLDENQHHPGIFMSKLEQGIQESRVVAACFGKADWTNWQYEEIYAAILKKAFLDNRRVIPVLLPNTQQQPSLPAFLGEITWVDLRPALTEDNLNKLIWGITGEKPPPASPISLALSVQIAPSRLPPAPEEIFGRDAELQRLDEAWANPGVHVLVIQAWGGAGKTALVAKWMAELAKDGWRGAERVFDWSFYSQGGREQGGASADWFIREALRFFGDAQLADGPASPWEKGARLAEWVAEKPSLLVLDGLEPLQYPPGPLAGRLKDPAISSLLKGLARRNNPGLCVVTTREAVADLSTWASTTAPLWALPSLPESEGVKLLRHLGVNGPPAEFRRLVQDVRGHALTLHLLGRFLAKAHQGDIRRRNRVKLDKAAGLLRDGHVFHVMEAYERWMLGDEEGERRLAVLRLLGLFDRPATQEQLAVLREAPAIPSLTEALQGLEEEEWNLVVAGLVEIGLLADGRSGLQPAIDLPEGGHDRGLKPAPTVGALDAHPLVREYFAKQLREQAPEAWRKGHDRLYRYLCGSVEYRPDTLEGLQPLYQAVYRGCQADLVEQAFLDVYWDRILRGNETYSTKKLGAVAASLEAVACFFTRPWRRLLPGMTEAYQAWLLNEAAYFLRTLGRLAEAVEPMRTGLEMRVRLEDWENAAISASNLSELELSLGDIPAALDNAEHAVAYAERSEDAYERMSNRTTWADALQHAGEKEAAGELFREAERLQAKAYPQLPWLNSVWGFRYCDWLLAEVEQAASRIGLVQATSGIVDTNALLEVCRQVEQRAQVSLVLAEENRVLLDTGLDHLSLGRAALYHELLSSHFAIGNLSRRSVDCVDNRSALKPPDKPVGSISGLKPDSWQAARQHLDAALNALRRSSHEDQIPCALLTRAWLHVLENQSEQAAALLDEAQEIAERGPMRLHLADIHLHRARLFRDRLELAKARELILQTGYKRRLPELADAEAALKRLGD